MKEIPLTQGLVALVDDEDYEYLSSHKWCAAKNYSSFYALRAARVNEVGKSSSVFMHRAILDAPRDMHVDHINGDGLDNRRENIRIATPGQNQLNRGRMKNNRSGYKGVCWNRSKQGWMAQIAACGVQKTIGRFSTPEEAHAAYCAAAQELHGEFARTA